MENYQIHENYRDDEILRNSFFDFTETVFPGIGFKHWYLKGFWYNNYISFSIVKENKIVSNVSISKMKIWLNNKLVNGIQFATVGTLQEYRKQGLSKYLMEYVLNKYKDEAEIFFLFANETVLDFYPKFGFNLYKEAVFEAKVNNYQSNFSARQLSINDEQDFAVIKKLLKERMDITKIFGASKYDFITSWHILNIFPQNLFYLEEEGIILIVTQDKDKLHLWDVICREPFDISSAILKVVPDNTIKSVLYYFSPDIFNFKYDNIILYNDSPLFILGDTIIKEERFKFPATAQT